ncbi:diacylglycerol kinase family lipid kinase [Pontibacillus sp. ALD_SL1]|uniref:diacylglycerol/lipid kinase family protein n=1 Tax=Pontibacillus sp. ALD_SL1 TaxID=2777185 RepID=UPI001A96F8D6|nr:diacylglycerol kinase family protein [Pontibacillus sp. ALD_SL1]QSS99288.1 diacylglycerol kinase family lipid kinase [Pontibacillus sp. ALD_SL1]
MYIVIVNPFAGSGKAKKVFEEVRQSPIYKEVECRAFLTQHEGHAEALVQQVTEIYKDRIICLIVIGGDGTIHEVLNGLKHHPSIPLAFIPGGSGNDFGKATLSKKDPIAIFKDIIGSEQQYSAYRVGSYLTDHRKEKNTRLFANSIGFGFDGEIVKAANNSIVKKWLNHYNVGFLIYCLALLRTLRSFHPKTIELTVDGEKRILTNVWMVTVGIHGYYGGGMRILPNARIQSNQVALLVLHNISKWKVLVMFVTVFWGGHVRFKEVEVLTGSKVSVKSEEVLSYHVDGESGSCQSCHIQKVYIPRPVFKGKK